MVKLPGWRLALLVEEMVCPDVSRLPIFAGAEAYREWHDPDHEEVCALLEDLEADFA